MEISIDKMYGNSIIQLKSNKNTRRLYFKYRNLNIAFRLGIEGVKKK